MSKLFAQPVIRLRGVRQNNLKNFDLDLPLGKLFVVTGLSGSGKSSLAFETLFAEGQRRYIETFSPYARQFFDRMDKPAVDSIEGIPPSIAIEQRNSVKSTRSTVGTMTEICDYMKVLWLHLSQLHCRQCQQPVRKESPQQIWHYLQSSSPSVAGAEILITFDLPLSARLPLADSLALVARQGYQRLLVGTEIVRIEDAAPRMGSTPSGPGFLTVVQDRLKIAPGSRARFVEASEQAFHFGKGRLTVFGIDPSAVISNPRPFSARLHCAPCDIEYREPTPALFSFNHPVGACPACRGFGRIISIDYNLAVPDRSKTLAGGLIKPWQSGVSADCQTDLMKFCRAKKIPTDVPFHDLQDEMQDWIINGEPDYGKDSDHEWPRAWYGVKGYFRWLESKSYKMHVRVLLSRYRSYTTCHDCNGQRFQPESLLHRIEVPAGLRTGASSMSLADFYLLPIRDSLAVIEKLATERKPSPSDPLGVALDEVRSRLGYLVEVGLGYLTLDRSTRSLSGGETERVNLTSCLGTRLVNTLFVLDEPSVGLHPRDTDRLVRILHQLRDTGNTVVVVEHEASVMRAADQIIDLGPGHGETGGHLVFQGSYLQILRAKNSLTGQYLSGRKWIERPVRRLVQLSPSISSRNNVFMLQDALDPITTRVPPGKSGVRPPATNDHPSPVLRLSHATAHNLRDVTVEIPLNRLVCLTGVSGSGKTTLMRDVLLPALRARLSVATNAPTEPDNVADADQPEINRPESRIDGAENLGSVVLVDQSPLGKTPRSTPAVYIGAFDDIREVFAQSDAARGRGLDASAFSFNSSQGQCERCRGAGFEKIEMQFLSDIFIRCPDCSGRRYRPLVLEVKVSGGSKLKSTSAVRHPASGIHSSKASASPALTFSIADLLEASVDEAISFLGSFENSKPAKRAVESLQLLQEVGLGYLRLGQPINTLSGGESQRLKLVSYLAEAATASKIDSQSVVRPNLFLFDEPTTGLHFDDVRILLQVFQRLVDAGHSVVVIEHNLDVIQSADWVIDLGPEAGDAGGQIVATGTPEEIMSVPASHTGSALREHAQRRSSAGLARAI